MPRQSSLLRRTGAATLLAVAFCQAVPVPAGAASAYAASVVALHGAGPASVATSPPGLHNVADRSEVTAPQQQRTDTSASDTGEKSPNSAGTVIVTTLIVLGVQAVVCVFTGICALTLPAW